MKRFRLIATIVFVLFLLSVPVSATEVQKDVQITPRGSLYLDAYRCSILPLGAGRVEFVTDVIGTRPMAEIGVLRIQVYESINNQDWYWVQTYSHSTYSWFMSYNEMIHSSSMTYSGIPGRYYKAHVTIWAGNGEDGDSRSFWTTVVKA